MTIQYNFEWDFRKARINKKKHDVNLNIPVYLEPKTLSFVEKIATKKKTDISTVVNDLIKTDMKIMDYIE